MAGESVNKQLHGQEETEGQDTGSQYAEWVSARFGSNRPLQTRP